MTLTAVVVSDRLQKSGMRKVRYEFHHPSGRIRHCGIKFIAPEADAQADANSMIDAIESSWKASELREAILRVAAEGRSMQLLWSTQAELAAFLVKRLSNASADVAVEYAPLAGLFTDDEVSTILGISKQAAIDWRAKLTQLATYASPGYYPEVE